MRSERWRSGAWFQFRAGIYGGLKSHVPVQEARALVLPRRFPHEAVSTPLPCAQPQPVNACFACNASPSVSRACSLPVIVMVADLVLNAKREKGAPPVFTGGWPIVGHFLRFAANPLATIRDGYTKHGPVFTMRFLHYNMTFLVGTEAHTPFFRANDTELSQNEPYKFMTPIFGEGIVFDAPIEVKNQQLKFVAGALKGSALKTYVSMIVDEVERFLESEWGAEGEKDLLDEMSNLTILTASRCLLGPEIRGTLFGTFSQLFREIDEGINPIAIFFPNAPLPSFRCVRLPAPTCALAGAARCRCLASFGHLGGSRQEPNLLVVTLWQSWLVPPLRGRTPHTRSRPRPPPSPPARLPHHPRCSRRDAARREISKIFGSVIEKRRSSPEGEKPSDMLQAFMDAEYADGSRCTNDQITGMLIGTLFAGQHTSSISSTWTILQLLQKPALLQRALDEMVVSFGTTSPTARESVNMGSVQQLSFLHNCMKEVLRMAPPLIMLMRKVHTPFTVCGVTVPRDHLVFAPVAVSMNLPNEAKDCAFKNPETFDPDRFVAPREEGKGTLAFAAFGGGTHGCLGEQFGYLQVKTIVSMILRRYEITAVGPLPAPNHQAMVVGPLQTNKSCVIRYKLRKTPLAAPAGWTAGAGAAAIPASA